MTILVTDPTYSHVVGTPPNRIQYEGIDFWGGGSHPEQYFATRTDDLVPIFYVRLRSGIFTAHPDNTVPWNPTFYLHIFDDEWMGEFDNEAQRAVLLAKATAEWIRTK